MDEIQLVKDFKKETSVSPEPAEAEARAALLEHIRPADRGRAKKGLRRLRGWRSWTAIGGATAASLAVALSLFGTDGNSGAPTEALAPTQAFGAELVRFAERSPRLLLDLPDWHIDEANERSPREGQMQFLPDEPAGDESGVPIIGRLGTIELEWQPGSLREFVADRASHSDIATTAPGPSGPAKVFRYKSVSGAIDGSDNWPGGAFTALWKEGNRVLEFSAEAPNLTVFENWLAALHGVDTAAWLNALPASVVKAADQEAEVVAMLRGIPVPSGFRPSDIHLRGLTEGRYQLGVAVTGTIACTWFQILAEAEEAGDKQADQSAARALGGAKAWPVLREMSQEGEWPLEIEGLAAEVQDAPRFDRSMRQEVEYSLGCAAFDSPIPHGQKSQRELNGLGG